MKAELQKFLILFEELEEACETASLTLVTKGSKSTIMLQLESSPSLPSTSTSTTTQPLPPASGRRRRHPGARGRAQGDDRCEARANLLLPQCGRHRITDTTTTSITITNTNITCSTFTTCSTFITCTITIVATTTYSASIFTTTS